MPELFRIMPNKQVMSINEQPFSNEVSDLEEFVFNNPTLLGEGVRPIARQVSSNAGRIDILAVDTAYEVAQIAIVELKNVPADVDVLLQVLRYANWVKSNPDSIKLLIQQQRINVPDLEMQPRLIVVAPQIREALIELSQYVNSFEFDFIEMRRFDRDGETFVVVARPSITELPTPPVSIRDEWSWDKYRAELKWSEERITLGQWLFHEVQSKVEAKEWPLLPRYRKGYIAFQIGGTRNVFGIKPEWANGFAIWFKLPNPPNESEIAVPENLQKRWNQNWKEYVVNIPTNDFDLDSVENLFKAAYEAAVM